MPQFPRQSSRPLSPVSIRASARRARALLDQIDHYADPQDARERQRLTRAINGLAHAARDLSRRHRGQSVAESLEPE